MSRTEALVKIKVMKQRNYAAETNPMWRRIFVAATLLFLVYCGDAVLSDWVPAFMQKSLGSPLLMGWVMAFSSMVGFAADLWFPGKLKMLRAKRILVLAIGASLVFAGILWWTTYWQVLGLFLAAMAVWGIYYEFLWFGGNQFVAEAVPGRLRSAVWAFFGITRSLAYFLGPVIGSLVTVEYGDRVTVVLAFSLTLLGYGVWRLGLTSRKHPVQGEAEQINILQEAGRWWVLGRRVWTVLLISFTLGLIDATFWTTGTVLTDKLVEEHWLGGMFLPFYMLPVIVVGLLIVKLKVHENKKKYAEIGLVAAGGLLAAIGLTQTVWIWLLLVLGVGIATSVTSPLLEAVYTDISTRMGSEKKHMFGLAGSTVSLAYVAGPIMAGALATYMDEQRVFAMVGAGAMVIGLILLMVTPRKIRLPQQEIEEWKTANRV